MNLVLWKYVCYLEIATAVEVLFTLLNLWWFVKKKKPTVQHMFFVRSGRVVYIKNKTIPFNNFNYKTTTVS